MWKDENIKLACSFNLPHNYFKIFTLQNYICLKLISHCFSLSCYLLIRFIHPPAPQSKLTLPLSNSFNIFWSIHILFWKEHTFTNVKHKCCECGWRNIYSIWNIAQHSIWAPIANNNWHKVEPCYTFMQVSHIQLWWIFVT